MRGFKISTTGILDNEKLSHQALLAHAQQLPAAHQTCCRKTAVNRQSLSEMKKIFELAFAFANESRTDEAVLPAISEWFYDNRYLFVEQIRQLETENGCRYLPHLKSGMFAGMPRCLVLAYELATHSAFDVTQHSIETFLEAYQRVSGLSSAELWAFVDMLRLVLLTAVSALAQRSINVLKRRRRAEKFCKRIEQDMLATNELIRTYKHDLLQPEFVAFTASILRESPHLAQTKLRMDAYLQTHGLDTEAQIAQSNVQQTKAILYISNAVTSLRTLAKLSFETVYENVSVVHRQLRADEGYTQMDFESREYYRRCIERIAHSVGANETAVASAALQMAAGSGEHVGVYITGTRKRQLMEAFGKLPVRVRISMLFRRHMLLIYIGSGVVSTLVSVALLTLPIFLRYPVWYGIIGVIISLIPIYTVAMTVNNRIFALINKPAFIPKLALTQGIPAHMATMVVIPTLLTSEKDAKAIIDSMRVYYAANQQPNLYFTLLSDFKGDKNEVTAQDEAIIDAVQEAIAAQNKRFKRDVFFYAQRRRVYNAKTKKYGGWERKRGALIDFCALLYGNESAFCHVTKGMPQGIKYVITLDADTELSRDAAVRLVGAMAHPLNRPVVDTACGVVRQGYGIMQPRISIDVVSALRSRFSLVFSGKPGLDTYACAVSDVYQDAFGTGIYTGKGIFDLDVYTQLLTHAYPDESVLSHDLLEGSYLRCALVTDVALMDGYPAKYSVWAARQHRWVRGDWQLLPWLKGKVKSRDGTVRKNPLTGLSKYQIFDNMRRSLAVPLSFLVILLSQTAFYRFWFFWLVSGVLPLFIDSILDFAARIISLIRNAGKGSLWKDAWHETRYMFERAFYSFSFLAYETYLMLDAAIRTVVRVCITHRNLLEWVTAAESERAAKGCIVAYWIKMRFAPILAAVLYALSIVVTRSFSVVAFMLFALWFFSPSIAYLVSRPRKVRVHQLSEKQQAHLTQIALKTWRFFERYTEESPYGWMPDNVQKSPWRGVAHRTSPTNIAFAMVSGIIAYYFGFCCVDKAAGQLERCINGIEKAEKWQGHLFNWYDIRDLKPLEPRYVSSVDNGNIACYLIVADQAMRNMLEQPIAAHLQQGLAAVSRESGQEVSFHINGDVFSAVGAIKLINDTDTPLGRMKHDITAHIETYAPWANVLYAFPASRVHLYTAQTKVLRDKLRQMSPGQFMAEWQHLLDDLDGLKERAQELNDNIVIAWVHTLENALGDGYAQCKKLSQRVIRLSQRMKTIFAEMDFGLMYDADKGLFSIGYNVQTDTLSDSHYDLMASEARQTGFIAIAKGDVPGKHWFRLARPLTAQGERRVLLSWGGTMFEYLMPLLIMKRFGHTLLDETYKAVVDIQTEYAETKRVPWGVSESGYYAFDLHMNYQYKAFGVPLLGMKSGLVNDLVVSPYATCLALHVRPRAAYANLLRLEKGGVLGRYGYFEAVDYTTSRMTKGQRKQIVKSYMAHHQGMIFAALMNVLHDGRLQQLFHNATIVKATESLLKEKVPPRSVTMNLGEKEPDRPRHAEEITALRTFTNVVEYPEAHFLGSGSYTVMLTQYGTGYSKFEDKMINRWYNDCLRRAPGIHVYIKNIRSGAVWSAALLPTCAQAAHDRVTFEAHKASFERQMGDVESCMDVCVSPESGMEIRRMTIRNNGEDAQFSVFCAFTPALCTEREFEAHPALAELFVDTRADSSTGTVYAQRRGKKATCAVKACWNGETELMTDRTAIFGRTGALGKPACTLHDIVERDVARAVCVKCIVPVESGKTKSISFAVAAGNDTRSIAKALGSVHSEEDIARVFHLAWTHAQVEMRHMRMSGTEANMIQKIASRTVIKVPTVHEITTQPGGLETLWKFSLSGDLPIICLFADQQEDFKTAALLVKAQEMMRQRQVAADLVIIYHDDGSYINMLRDKVRELAAAASSGSNRVIALSSAHLSDTDIATIVNAACLVLKDTESLAKQLKVGMLLRSYRVFNGEIERLPKAFPKQLKAFDNGRGGFVRNGAAYSIDSDGGRPLPWSNILANPQLGSLVSAGGGGYTWADNARMTRLTPFRNDGLTDVPGEGILVRNDRTGAVYSIAHDIYASGKHRVTHGFGYTTYERFGTIDTSATVFVDTVLPVKAQVLRITNSGRQKDTFSVYYYAEPMLSTAACTGTNAVYQNGVLAARCCFANPDRRMFIAIPGRQVRYTASAREFFGTPGNNMLPEALKTDVLSNSDGQGADVMALQTHIELKPGASIEMPLIMGYASEAQKQEIIDAFDNVKHIKARLEETKAYWQQLTDGITVSTKMKSFDTLVNGWLLYQTYAARLLGRTGYYQSGGAYGFRDQLQDVLALVYTDPQTTRAHIIKCAERQFIEGDVLHWWHEPMSGVRTKISDDKLFLPFVTCEYARITGDMAVFDEQANYLKSERIPAGRHDLYKPFEMSDERESVFMHCVRAIRSASRTGQHGLPLMGTGDWNDGMDKVGEHGRGESVWMAFFLAEVLRLFGDICRRRGEDELADEFEKQREELKLNAEKNAWDGEWYMRAFFDDGTPLGSVSSPECKIDLLSQAWAVLSGAIRSRKAFEAAESNLVLREEGIIRLLTPAFDKWDKDPGYIKDYLPGVRENGGQYTHAASWFVIAAARLRLKDKAMALFQMLNPINHTRTPADVEKYKGEPYVMAADVYDTAKYKGRAGWTWYTGTAGWMYQAAVTHILGMHIENGELSIQPCVPDDFGAYTITYRFGETQYEITVSTKPGYMGSAWLKLDGSECGRRVKLDGSGGVHKIFACWQP